MLIPSLPGARMYIGISEATFRRVALGLLTATGVALLVSSVPGLLIPSLLEARLCIGISEATFRKVVLGLLTATGVALLVSSVPGLLRRLV